MSILASAFSVFCLEGLRAYNLSESHNESQRVPQENDAVVIFMSGQNVDLQKADYYKNLEVFMQEIHSQIPNIYVSNEHQSRWQKLCLELENLKNPITVISDKVDIKIRTSLTQCLNHKIQSKNPINWVEIDFDNNSRKVEWRRDLASLIIK